MISIVILTKNPGRRIEEVLVSVFEQKTIDDYEVIIVDSGTTDGSLDIMQRFDVRLSRIEPRDFSHSRTRNYAVTLSRGEYVVMLVQDAVPSDEKWLSELVAPMKEDNNIAGVYSRHIPYQRAKIMEKSFISFKYPDKAGTKQKKDTLTIKDVFFSNVSSAMRRDLLGRFKFDETLIMSEDQQWAKKIIENGYSIVYNPKSIVYHSHNYTLKTVFKRFFDSGVSMKNLGLVNRGNYKDGLDYLFYEMRYCFKAMGGAKFSFYFPYLALYEFMRICGFVLGQNYKKLPSFFLKKFSYHKYHWDI